MRVRAFRSAAPCRALPHSFTPPSMPCLPDLAAALTYSRYCASVLAARPEERMELETKVALPFDWIAAEASIAAAAEGAALSDR